MIGLRWFTRELERRDRAHAEERARWDEERRLLLANAAIERAQLLDRIAHADGRPWPQPRERPEKEPSPIVREPENYLGDDALYVDPDSIAH